MIYSAAMEIPGYETSHRVITGPATSLSGIESESTGLVLTSPPYPMISMWDELFGSLDSTIAGALEREEGSAAFEAMHRLLDPIWDEAARLLIPGGIACINIGDALRTIGGDFRLYPNAARIIEAFGRRGFQVLPRILWRKGTNAPNKFMGSGMLPGGAYVTLEHEHILIFRKGGKRLFPRPEQKALRRQSAYFWEERNRWFSDLWDLGGVRQTLKTDAERQRSAAFPMELAWRIIQMYTVQGDLVVDPFLGTGTSSLAALAAGRSSLGTEIDPGLADSAVDRLAAECAFPIIAPELRHRRLHAHAEFIEDYRARKGEPKYRNQRYDFPVVTSQERELILPELLDHRREGEILVARHGL